MPKKLVKKRKLKVFNLLISIIVLGTIVFGIYLYLQIPVKNIIIKNNKYLNDDYIIELAKLKDYPRYYEYSSNKMKKNIMKSPYISKVSIKRKFYHTIEIKVTENKAIFYRDSDKKIVFSNKKSITQDSNFVIFRIPRLLNYVPNNIYNNFIKSMNEINSDTLSRISEISYNPNDIDNERFLLYMDDGNMVYLTLTKFSKINHYNTVLEQLENRKGILYLDNGNHFQIKE